MQDRLYACVLYLGLSKIVMQDGLYACVLYLGLLSNIVKEDGLQTSVTPGTVI